MLYNFSSNVERALLAIVAQIYPLELGKEYRHTLHGRDFSVTRHQYIHPDWTELRLTRWDDNDNTLWHIRYAVAKDDLDVMVGIRYFAGVRDDLHRDLVPFLMFAD